MDKEYLVYEDKVYSNFVNYINGYILLSKAPAMLEEGDVPYSFYESGDYEGYTGSSCLIVKLRKDIAFMIVSYIKVRNLQSQVTSMGMMILQHPILMCEYWFLIKNF